MDEQQTPPTGNSTADFIAQQGVPTIPSKEGEQNEQSAQQQSKGAQSMPPPPPPPPGYTAPAGAQPIFEDLPGSEDPASGPGNESDKPRSKEYKQMVVKGFINSEDFFTAMICGAIADMPVSEFRAGEEEKQALLDSLEPYVEWITEKCPAWIPVLAMYGMMKGQQVIRVVKVVKENKKRERAAKRSETYAPLKDKVATDGPKGGRKNFKLHKSGQYYYNDRNGQYVKSTDEKERPSIDDLENICNGGNTVDVILLAFPNLNRAEIEKLTDGE